MRHPQKQLAILILSGLYVIHWILYMHVALWLKEACALVNCAVESRLRDQTRVTILTIPQSSLLQLTEAAEVWSLMLVWYSQSFCTYSSSNFLWSTSYSSFNHCRACSSQSSEIQYIFRLRVDTHTNVIWVMEFLTCGYKISLILSKQERCGTVPWSRVRVS